MSPGRLLGAALAVVTSLGIAACGGEPTKVAAHGAGTYVSGSSEDEYCGLLAATSPQISHDLTAAQPAAVQPAISALGDLSVVAPEEVKVDLALIRGYLQMVIDANGEGAGVTDEELAAADAALDEVNERVSESVETTCGLSLE